MHTGRQASRQAGRTHHEGRGAFVLSGGHASERARLRAEEFLCGARSLTMESRGWNKGVGVGALSLSLSFSLSLSLSISLSLGSRYCVVLQTQRQRRSYQYSRSEMPKSARMHTTVYISAVEVTVAAVFCARGHSSTSQPVVVNIFIASSRAKVGASWYDNTRVHAETLVKQTPPPLPPPPLLPTS